jgi:hypothetical protein
VSSWVGVDLDDVSGAHVGRVLGGYVDAESSEPVWLIVAIGRRRRAKKIVVPLRECAVAAGRAWVAQERGVMREAPTVDSTRPLLREHEATICAHYGVGGKSGRNAELAGRAEGAVTAEPALV